MSSELVLLCWLLGNEPYRIFTVKIQGSETVSTLKEKIKEKKSDIDCPADALIIWKNETSNTDEGSLFGLNQDVCRNIPGARKLDAWHRLSTVFTDALEYEQKIHVFVQSPTLFIRPNSPISSGSVDWDIELPFTSRTETVSALYRKLCRHRFIYVRGTPGTGKTTLVMLLRHHIEKKELGMKVILFDSWPESGNYEVNLAARGWNSHDKFVLLFDEGQSTYRHFGLWTFFKHVSDGNAEAYNNRVIIFCRHGSPSRRPMDIVMPELRLPFCLPLCKRVSLCSVDYSDLDETPPAGLFLTSMEFGDLIHRRFHHNHFDSAFFNWVYQFTGGHVGGIVELISLIISTDSYRGLRNEELYSRDHVQAELDDLLDRFDNISIGLPSNKVLQTPAITHVLGNICSSTVIRESTFLTAEHRDALQTCYLNGWVHAELLLDNTDGSDGYVLASPLHQRILERKLWGRVPLRSFMSPQVTLLDFVIAVIHEYSPHNLSAGWTIGPGGARRPDGTQFQDEFYRCAHAISPGSTTIFPEYGVGNGTVVFYIPAKKWAVELFPGNQQLAQHCGHFLSSGTYCKHLDISEYIILDFGTTTPRIPHTALQNIYYIVFSEDFSSVRVLNDELKVIQGSILLSAC